MTTLASGSMALMPRKAVHAVVLGHHQIERADVGAQLLIHLDGHLPVAGFAGDFPARALRGVLDDFSNDEGVVGDQ